MKENVVRLGEVRVSSMEQIVICREEEEEEEDEEEQKNVLRRSTQLRGLRNPPTLG